MAVIYLFLRSLRATIIPGVAVPLSLVATFGVMALLGYSLNNLTLMALTISTGFVVDDAIVMIENIARYIEEGDTPLEAALKGAKQIGFTIVSLTVSLVAVLIPLLFMGGVIGRLFREFAVTLSTAIVASALISLTLTADDVRATSCVPIRRRTRGAVARASERGVRLDGEGLRPRARLGARAPALTLVATIATVVFTVVLAVIIPKGLFPQQDTGLLLGVTEAPTDVSFPTMMELQQSAVDVIRVDPDVDNVASFIGADGTNPTLNTGRLSITLKSRAHRKANAQEIIDRLSSRLGQLDRRHRLPAVGAGPPARQPVEPHAVPVHARGRRPEELVDLGAALLEQLRKLPELADVASDQQDGALQMTLVIDRDTASRLGDHRAGDRRHALRRLRPAARSRRSSPSSTSTA